MSIYSAKFDQLVERIISDAIKSGQLPTSSETISRIVHATSKKNLAKPEFQFFNLYGKMVIGSKEYIAMLDAIRKDLELIYANYQGLYSVYVRSMRNYEVDKNKLENRLQILEDKLKEKILIKADTSTLNSVYDTFNTSSQIDMSQSSIDLDLLNHKVTIPAKGVGKITDEYLEDVSLDLSEKFNLAGIVRQQNQVMSSKTISGSLLNIFSSQVNKTWTEEVISADSAGAGLTMTITFRNISLINKIEFNLFMLKPCYIRLSYSPDGINRISLPYYETSRLCKANESFTFPNIGIKSMYVELTKAEPDKTTIMNGKDYYVYYFGMSGVSFYSNGYATSGVLMSKPLYVDNNASFPVNKVALETSSIIPLDTSINYYVALADSNPIWYAISDLNDDNPAYPKVIDFKNVSESAPATFNISSDLSLKERILVSLKTNGINFYSLGSVGSSNNPITLIEDSARLYKGVGFWRVKSYQQNMGIGYLPQIKDWFSIEDLADTSYVSIESNKVLDNISTAVPTSYKLSLTFECPDQISVRAKPTCGDNTHSFPMAVYINTKLISQSAVPQEITYTFQKGFNQIDILIYKDIADANLNLDLNIDLNKLGSSFYADSKSMELTTLFNLQHHIPSNNHDYYAITVINGKNTIVVNEIIPDINYEFHYRYLNSNTSHGLLFKAELTSDRPKCTPAIDSYRLKLM